MTPIFLVSLPRSGSTLLQKILMTHPRIASTAEPWFLLPLCHMRIKQGVSAQYGHVQSVNALNRMESELGQDYVDNLIKRFALGIYSSYGSGEETYFLDKTPRYYYILPELARIFPDAKFVVLLRNPVSMAASAIEAFCANSTRRFDQLDRDFYVGPQKIADFVQTNRDKLHLLTYEQLVSKPEECIRGICDFLEIEYHYGMISDSFEIDLKGHGDHLGARSYQQIVLKPEKWKEIINTHYRKWRIRRLVGQFSADYLSIGNYDKNVLLRAIALHHPAMIGLKEYGYLIEEVFVRLYCRLVGWMRERKTL